MKKLTVYLFIVLSCSYALSATTFFKITSVPDSNSSQPAYILGSNHAVPYRMVQDKVRICINDLIRNADKGEDEKLLLVTEHGEHPTIDSLNSGAESVLHEDAIVSAFWNGRNVWKAEDGSKSWYDDDVWKNKELRDKLLNMLKDNYPFLKKDIYDNITERTIKRLTPSGVWFLGLRRCYWTNNGMDSQLRTRVTNRESLEEYSTAIDQMKDKEPALYKKLAKLDVSDLIKEAEVYEINYGELTKTGENYKNKITKHIKNFLSDSSLEKDVDEGTAARNREWMVRFKSILEENKDSTILFVVGARHLGTGEGGLLTLLAQEGFNIEVMNENSGVFVDYPSQFGMPL